MAEDNIYFIDTNIFIRSLIKEDNKIYNDCLKLLELIKNSKIKAYTSSLVYAEISWVLESFYKFDRNETAKALRSISGLSGLKILNKINSKIAIDIYSKFNVKFIDAMIASNPLILQKKMKIISYDRDFDKIGVTRIEPAKLLSLSKK